LIGVSNSHGRLRLGDYRGGELINKITGRALLSNPDFQELTADKSSGYLGHDNFPITTDKSSPKRTKTAVSIPTSTLKKGTCFTKLTSKMTATDCDPQTPAPSKQQVL